MQTLRHLAAAADDETAWLASFESSRAVTFDMQDAVCIDLCVGSADIIDQDTGDMGTAGSFSYSSKYVLSACYIRFRKIV